MIGVETGLCEKRFCIIQKSSIFRNFCKFAITIFVIHEKLVLSVRLGASYREIILLWSHGSTASSEPETNLS